MAGDRSMGFNITALDRASKTFVKLAEQVERLSRKLDDLDRKVANPRIEPDVDTKSAEAKLGKFARDVRRRLIEATRALPDIDLNVNSTQAEREIAGIRARLRELSGKTIGVDIDANVANAEITRLQQRLRALSGQSANVAVRADTAAAAAALAQIERQLNRLDGRTTRVKADTSHASRAFASLSTNIGGVSFGLGRMGLATGIAVAGLLRLQMAGAIAAAGVAVIPPIVGTLASALLQLPAVVSVAIAGIGTLALAFSGIGTAVKALAAEDKKSAQTSEANAKAREASSHRIQSATETLEDAVRSESRTHRAGLEQVRAAEQSLTAAQRSARQAQEDLTRAREDAREQLEDLQLSVRGAALSERQAALDLADAKDRLREAQSDGTSGRDLERLVLGVEQAALSYDEAKERAQDLNAEQAEWQRTGIEGSRSVQAALMGVQTANEGVAQAQEAMTQAQLQASEASADAARQVTRAQQELARAMQDTGDVGSAAVDKVEQAFANLSPVAADFARFIYSLRPAFDQLRASAAEGFLPEFKQGIIDLLPLMLVLNDGIKRIGEGLGAMWRGFTDVAGSLSGMVRINEILSNTATFFDHMAPVVSNITDSFLTLAAEGTAAFEELAGELNIWSDGWNEMVQRITDEGVLEGAFHNLNRVVGELLGLFTDLVEIGVRWMDQVGDDLADLIGGLGVSFKELAPGMGDASEKLLQLATDILPDLTAFLKDVIPYLPDMAAGFTAILLAVLPLLKPLFQMQAMLGELHSAVLEPLLPILNDVVGGIVWLREELGFFALLPPVFWPLVFLYKGLDDVLGVTEKLQTLWGYVWPFLQNVAQGAWDNTLSWVLPAIKTGVDGVRDGFNFAKDAAQWFWDKLTAFGDWWGGSTLKKALDGMLGLLNEIKGLADSLGGFFGGFGGSGFQEAPKRDLKNKQFNAQGNLLLPMAAGGLTAMSGSTAKMVQPNTFRVIGDRMSGAEAFIPLDGSARSRAILGEAAARMGYDLAPMAEGGVLGKGTFAPENLQALQQAMEELTGKALVPMAEEFTRTATPAVQALQAALPPLRDETVNVGRIMRDDWGLNTAAVTNARTSFDESTGAMRGAVEFLRNTATTAWQNMRAVTGAEVGQITGPIFGGLNAGMANVQTQAQQTATFWQQQMASLMAAAANPIRWIMQFPLGPPGLAASWNALDDQFKLGKRISPPAPGFATGGIYPGYTPGRDVGYAAVSGGEGIMRPEWTRAVGPDYVHAANKAARMGGVSGVRAFLGGGREEGAKKLRLMRRMPLDGLFTGHYAYGGVQPHVAAAGAEIERVFGPMPGGIGGVGQRANASDHPSGHALDFMTLRDKPLGDRVAGHLLANARRMMVKYLIWQQAINEGGGWSRMEDRGSITANHFDHVHSSFLRLGQGGRDFGGGGLALFDPGPIVDGAFKRTYDMVGDITRFFGTSNHVSGNQSVTRQLVDTMRTKALEQIGATLGAAGGGAGVERWRGMVHQALGIMGQPLSMDNVTLRRMNQESGGNPTAVNLWDSNAAKGTPSVGLMQVIRGTYAANKHPQFDMGPYMHGVSVDPLSNTLASMRYAVNRYGGLPAAYNRPGGYGNGAIFTKPTLGLLGEAGPEVVLPANRPQRASSLARQAGIAAPVIGHLTVNAAPQWSADDVVRSAMHQGRVAARRAGR